MRNAECGVARRAFDSALRTPHSAFAVGGGCEEWSARRHHGGGSRDAIGTAADGLWAGLVARRSAVRAVTRFDPTPFRSRIAAEIPDFRPQDHLRAERAHRLDRFS